MSLARVGVRLPDWRERLRRECEARNVPGEGRRGSSRLARRAPDFTGASHRAWVKAHGADALDTPFSRSGWSSPGRVVAVRSGPDGPAAITGPGPALPLDLAGPAPAGRPWGARIAAPVREADLPAVFTAIGQLARHRPTLVAVHGGTPLTRTLVCERARLLAGIPALLIDDNLDTDRAVTAVLSGRADLVGAPAGALRTQGLLA